MTYAERARAFLMREMGEEAVAAAERKAAEKPMRMPPMGDKADLLLVQAVVCAGVELSSALKRRGPEWDEHRAAAMLKFDKMVANLPRRL